jgi:hypothetical protein
MFVFVYRAALSYITGSHTFKVGFNDGRRTVTSGRLNTSLQLSVQQRRAQSAHARTEQIIHTKYDHDLGFYAQDKWTKKRLTLNYGVRLDYFANTIPAQFFGPSALAPNRNLTFAEQPNLSLKDFTPHVTAVYDLFGNGKTALKGSVNKYLAGMINMTAGPGALNNLVFGPGAVNNVIEHHAGLTDSNGNFRPDCDLLNPNAHPGPGASWNPNADRMGPSQLQLGILGGYPHEIPPRVPDVGYFRRIYGNFLVTHDLNARLRFQPLRHYRAGRFAVAERRGYAITGLYDVSPAKLGRHS